MTVYAARFVQILLSQRGDDYRYAGEINPLSTKNPDGYDCSEFTQWGAYQAGGYLPDGSGAQHDYCKHKGTMISVAQAIKTPGALLFHPGHVAVSLGNGHTIEACSTKLDVGVFTAYDRGWTSAALVPGMVYGSMPKPPSANAPAWPGRYLTQPPVMKMLAAEETFQKRLVTLGLYGGPIDRLYGPSMESAVRHLQDRRHLRIDGIAGHDTWYAAWRS